MVRRLARRVAVLEIDLLINWGGGGSLVSHENNAFWSHSFHYLFYHWIFKNRRNKLLQIRLLTEAVYSGAAVGFTFPADLGLQTTN